MVDIVNFDEWNFPDPLLSDADFVNLTDVTLDDLGDLDSGLNESWFDDQSDIRSPSTFRLFPDIINHLIKSLEGR